MRRRYRALRGGRRGRRRFGRRRFGRRRFSRRRRGRRGANVYVIGDRY